MPIVPPPIYSNKEADYQSGFTLLELMVVLVIVSIMMAVSIPRFRNTVITDPLKRAARQVIGMVREARLQAVESPQGCAIIISVDDGEFSLFCPQAESGVPSEIAESDDEFSSLGETAEVSAEPVKLLTIAEPVKIRSIWNGVENRFTIGEVTLWVNSDGIIEPSVINLSDGSEELGLTIFPFISDIRIDDEVVVPDGYTGSEALL